MILLEAEAIEMLFVDGNMMIFGIWILNLY